MFPKKKTRKAAGGAEEAKKAAVSLLADKENTEKELFDKLVTRGFSPEDAEIALAYVVGKGYLCEERYFLRFVENCARSRLLGRRRILAEAKQKGFSEKTTAALSQRAFEDMDFDALCYEAYKRCRLETKEKIAQALLRRGYDVSNVRAAFEKAAKAADEQED